MEQNLNKPGQEALDRLRRIAELAPQDPELRLDLARALLEHSMKDEAVDQLQLVISKSPNHLEARKLLALALNPPVQHSS